jgi:hypothetical protein
MSEASQINDGVSGTAQKPVFNPKAPEELSKDVVVQKSSKLVEKIIYLLGAGMKRFVVVKKPDGTELIRIPLTLFIILVILSQLIVLIVSAILVVFFKWKIELEDPKPPAEKDNVIKKESIPGANNPI